MPHTSDAQIALAKAKAYALIQLLKGNNVYQLGQVQLAMVGKDIRIYRIIKTVVIY